MTRRISVLTLILGLLGAMALLAHNEIRVVGVITSVQPNKLEVKTKAGRTYSMEVDKETTILRDKTKADASALKVGQSVVVDACGDPKTLLALQVRIVPAITPAAAKK